MTAPTFGPGGYPDWQRLTNYDGPTAWSINQGGIAARLIGPMMDMSRYATLSTFMEVSGGPTQIGISWFLDQAGTVLVGQRTIMMGVNPGESENINLLNLGPWAQIEISPIGAGVRGANIVAHGTNRTFPSEVAPNSQELVYVDGVTLQPNTDLTVIPSGYWSGPVVMWARTDSNITTTFQALAGNGAWNDFWQLSPGSISDSSIVVIPLGEWQVILTNGSTTQTGTANLTIIAPISGAT